MLGRVTAQVTLPDPLIGQYTEYLASDWPLEPLMRQQQDLASTTTTAATTTRGGDLRGH